MLRKLLDFLLPYRCVLCDSPSDTQMNLCQACYNDLPWLKATCQVCAKPLPGDFICGHCQQHPPQFDRTLSLLHYQPPLVKLIRHVKFNRNLIYANLLGQLLAKHLAAELKQKPDCIIPVPLHRHRRLRRGFNQATEIAKPVSKKLAIPLMTRACKRSKATKAQAQIKAEKRASNLKGAFKLVKPLPGKHIAIIDDVITTGSTINELSRILRQAGASYIEVWSITRTSIKK